jgi:hypothetical protein
MYPVALPEEIEIYRDRMWRREPERLVEDVLAAEQFIESVGFCSALTDSRRPGPSLFIAVLRAARRSPAAERSGKILKVETNVTPKG